MLHSKKLLDHFRNPRNSGELANPDHRVNCSNPVCGDTLQLTVRWERGTIAEVAYKCRGCTAAIACGSALTELIAGRSREQIAQLQAADIAEAVGGLATESGHAASLCMDALKLLLSRP